MGEQRNLRKTIAKEESLEGIGLHSGKKTVLVFTPAPPNTGVIFTRKKHFPQLTIEAVASNVVDTSLAVTLGNGKWRIQTVEHLMAALHMCGITDLYIDTTEEEIPILDGSAQPYCDFLTEVGIVDYPDDFIEPIEIRNPVWVLDGDKYLIALPSKSYDVSYNIHFDHPLLRGQNHQLTDLDSRFLVDIAPARTFGFLAEVEYLRTKGLAKGGSIDNAVVLDEKGYLNPSLRYDDECVRHKILDLVGDLALLGRPLRAHVIANKSGHALDVALAKKILWVEEQNVFANKTVSSQYNKSALASIS